MLVLAIYQARAGAAGLAAFATLSGFIFVGIGIGMILTLHQGSRAQAAIDLAREQQPDAPWLWRSDWAAGHILSEGSANILGAWLLATFWNAIVWPIFYFLYFNPNQPSGAFAGLRIAFAILPLSGIVMIGYAVRVTLRWVAARGSYFEMESIPGQIGGELSGTIRLMPPSRANREFKVKLSCISRKGDSAGRNGVAEERVLFSDQRTVRGSAFGGISVLFEIPPECHSTGLTDSEDMIVWRLDIAAPFSSRTFEARFEVPVFRVEVNPDRRGLSASAGRAETPDDRSFVPPPNFPVRTRELPTGATEFYFPPCRAPAAAVGAALFVAGWTAMFLMILHIDAPVVFDAVWAAFDAFMIVWVVSLWLGDTRVTLDGSSITIANGIPGLVLLRRTIPASEVHAVAATAGSRTGRSTYYRLRLIHGRNRTLTFGDGLREKRAAEWLAQEIADRLGVA